MLMEEMLLSKKLISLGANLKTLWAGITTREERKPQMRLEAIKYRDVTFTVRDGKRITIGDQFYAAYHEEL